MLNVFSDHMETINETREKLKKNRKRLPNCDQQTKKRIYDDFQVAAITCGESCDSLLRKAPEQLHKSIKCLHDKCLSFQNLTMDDTAYEERVGELSVELYKVWTRIDEYQKDQKARIP